MMAWESYVFDDLGMSTQVGEEWNRSDIDVTAPEPSGRGGRNGVVTV